MRGWLVIILMSVIGCIFFAILRIFLFFVGQKTWKALQPKGEICLVAGLGKKLVSLAGGGSRERASREVVQ